MSKDRLTDIFIKAEITAMAIVIVAIVWAILWLAAWSIDSAECEDAGMLHHSTSVLFNGYCLAHGFEVITVEEARSR